MSRAGGHENWEVLLVQDGNRVLDCADQQAVVAASLLASPRAWLPFLLSSEGLARSPKSAISGTASAERPSQKQVETQPGRGEHCRHAATHQTTKREHTPELPRPERDARGLHRALCGYDWARPSHTGPRRPEPHRRAHEEQRLLPALWTGQGPTASEGRGHPATELLPRRFLMLYLCLLLILSILQRKLLFTEGHCLAHAHLSV